MAAAAAPALLRHLGSRGAAAGASRRRPAGLVPTAEAARPWRWQPASQQLLLHARSTAQYAAPAAAQHTPAASAASGASTPTAEAAPAADQPHVSVLLREVLAAFEGLAVRRYVDGTLGAAGHASAVLAQHPELQTLVGFDLDPTAHALASARLAAAGAAVVPVAVSLSGAVRLDDAAAAAAASGSRTAFIVRSNFGRMRPVLQQLPLGGDSGGSGSPSSSSSSSSVGVDAILLDLGISSMQVDTADRGFSFLRDGPLDMRMDPAAGLSAEQLVNTWSEAEIGRVIREYGEERHWRGIARRIVAAREEEAITTTQQLVKAIGSPGGGGRGGGKRDTKYKHPATRTFQAIRIAVNSELQSIAQVLPDAIECLAPGGRLAVITFHSLEDRIVKWAFRRAAGMSPSDEALPSYCLPFEAPQEEATIKILTRKPILPSEEEQAANARSRSAKLRVVEKL
ncbi:Ribosomal RNA small subunit methyltransferase H [Chlorella sorokiniana]|uniref:Ribosomal RNA small subunit methyltransferase H n=1 Tax=Chlorella sorokiniana TaxID=3076 RepID=A0A2P6TP81_CHLSO|nr:Ribosomal RNA small subunit methyltransferase H [Chlorella sorokiniana]|eukprot:PRW51138.1 Ribosomal RNA small subunit methyltransferase H [Chlorella sorokiniana]